MSEAISPLAYRLPEERLLLAIQGGDAKSVEELLEEANVSHPLFMGGKLLSVACTIEPNNLQIIEHLLKKGCSTSHPDLSLHRNTPLHLMAKKGNIEAVHSFLHYGADVNQTNRFGMTPLHMAAIYGHVDVAKLLLVHGSSIDRRDAGGNTPLFLAVSGGNNDAVEMLISGGCNLDPLNEEMLSPLDEALMNNKSNIISLLLRGGCRTEKEHGYVYYSRHYCNSVLYTLIEAKDLQNITLLMECGYSPDVAALYSMTNALEPAKQYMVDVVRKVFMQPPPLMCLSRNRIRTVLNEKRLQTVSGQHLSLAATIDLLPLPKTIKDYVAIKVS